MNSSVRPVLAGLAVSTLILAACAATGQPSDRPVPTRVSSTARAQARPATEAEVQRLVLALADQYVSATVPVIIELEQF